MKKYGIVFIIILLCSGCGIKEAAKEKVVTTCRQDIRYDIYSVTTTNTVLSKDNKTISSLKTVILYTASFDDTNFDTVRKNLNSMADDYYNNYQDVKAETIDEKTQIAFTVEMPLNAVNIKKFEELNKEVVVNNQVNIDAYKKQLVAANYTCK